MKELIVNAMENLDEDLVMKLVQQAIEEGVPSSSIIQFVKTGVEIVGEKFEHGEFFIADLMMAGIIFKQILAMEKLEISLKSFKNYNHTILIGTVYDDLHDIGKDIFASIAKSSGFQVVDIGVDVNAKKFADYIIKIKPDILAMSGVLRSSLTSMADIVQYLSTVNLRDCVKIIIGGAFLTQEANDHIGADAFTKDAAEGIKICKEWMDHLKVGQDD
ncbi:MAG: cobalamin B12-binding domain-containing protein [Eubacteriales bacterium]